MNDHRKNIIVAHTPEKLAVYLRAYCPICGILDLYKSVAGNAAARAASNPQGKGEKIGGNLSRAVTLALGAGYPALQAAYSEQNGFQVVTCARTAPRPLTARDL